MPTLSETSDSDLEIVHNYFIIFFNVLIDCLCAGAFRMLVIFIVFVVLLEMFVPLVNVCFILRRLAKSNIQTLKYSAALYSIVKAFTKKFYANSLSRFFHK